MNALSDLQLRVSHALKDEEERVRVRAERKAKKEEAGVEAPVRSTDTIDNETRSEKVSLFSKLKHGVGVLVQRFFNLFKKD
jgi:hypothetical protein